MRKVLFRAGRPAEVVEASVPVPGPGQLLVCTEAVGVGVGLVRMLEPGGPADKADFARECGADEVVTYSQPSWGDPVDLVLDGVGGELSSAALTLWPRSAGWSPSAPAAAPSAPEACSAN